MSAPAHPDTAASAVGEKPGSGVPAGVPDLGGLRRDYHAGGLTIDDLAPTWVEQFAGWLADAARLTEPNAMVLATADAAGRPSARTVLLKAFDARGFVLFTNYTSRKAQEALANPYASLVFPWYPLDRQVTVVGAVERLPADESAAYFRSRPRGSQLGAWASRQSSVIASRAELTGRRDELDRRWPGEIPVPEFWGGLRVVPATVEFWHGRPDRLHDRLQYRRLEPGRAGGDGGAASRPGQAQGPGEWVVERLSP